MSSSIPLYLIPSFIALFIYGIGQGLVKKWSDDVPPALFCLFLILARSLVNVGYFLTQKHDPMPFTAAGVPFLLIGILAYILDGLGWILYFESIIYGPITIVGTLSATYPALTLLFAQIFLHEKLVPLQYMGVAMVLMGCLGLSYSPPDPDSKATSKRWIPLALCALLCWGAAQTFLRYSYSLPDHSDSNMAIYATMGGTLTLGLYGAIKLLMARRRSSEKGPHVPFLHSFLPMAMMAGGDLGVIVATSTGPASIVAPLTGAYPLVTLGFAAMVLKEHISKLQWVCLAILLAGIGFSTIPQAPAEPAAAAPAVNSAPASPTGPGQPASPSASSQP